MSQKLKDILVIVLFATLADAYDWIEIAMLAEVYQDYLWKYMELKNDRNEGKALKKIICIDGTMRSNKRKKWKPFHIVPVWRWGWGQKQSVKRAMRSWQSLSC